MMPRAGCRTGATTGEEHDPYCFVPERRSDSPRRQCGFPRDEYTPHGYLATPESYATSWLEGSGGNLRSTRGAIGFGWLYPWARDAVAGAQLEIGLGRTGSEGTTDLAISREYFETGPEPPTAPHHSSLLFEYRFFAFGALVEARFTLLDPDELAVEIDVTPGPAVPPAELTLYVAALGWRTETPACRGIRGDGPPGVRGSVELGVSYPIHELLVDDSRTARPLPLASSLAGLVSASELQDPTPRELHGREVAVGVAIPLGPDVPASRGITAILRRCRRRAGAKPPGRLARRVAQAVARAREQDDLFWRGAARLEGDWPDAWRRGWVYDLETTRMCIMPPGGVFTDVWPSWMIQWPRTVVAEGTLHAFRLGYANPRAAQRAVLSLFRDATASNVPCVFRGGQPNMVARDGSVCGTSPAWCVPFYNLERLYLHVLDREWLAALYPALTRYLDWWLRERIDAEGWAVYRCTWEAGEDDTPRLDPDGRGDNVVSELVRPVELQAALALSAAVLGRFAVALDHDVDVARWLLVRDDFAERTRSLWDDVTGRFRDWDQRGRRFLEPSGEPNYWGIDPCRYSVLAFAPLLAGLTDDAQRRALTAELARYASPPWTLWPSWSYILLEAADMAGAGAWASRLADDVVARVYEELDRRSIDAPRGPTPGVAREYWPLDLAEWSGCEGYGWGATTASFVVRQIFGFREGDYRAGIRFSLTPRLPDRLVRRKGHYRLSNLPYRDVTLELEYAVEATERSSPDVRVRVHTPTTCRVIDARERRIYQSPAASPAHAFEAEMGHTYQVELGQG